MNGTIMSLKHDVNNVKRDESRLKRDEMALKHKVDKIEHKKGDNWGEEGNDDTNSVHMDPLPFHHRRHLAGHSDHHHKPLGNIFSGIGEFFKKLSHPHKTGPASEHKSKPIIPTHNITKPGAHPAYAKKDEKE